MLSKCDNKEDCSGEGDALCRANVMTEILF